MLLHQTICLTSGHIQNSSMEKNDEDDWDELAKEERMAKKLRKGEVSQQDFDAAFAEL